MLSARSPHTTHESYWRVNCPQYIHCDVAYILESDLPHLCPPHTHTHNTFHVTFAVNATPVASPLKQTFMGFIGGPSHMERRLLRLALDLEWSLLSLWRADMDRPC